MLSRKRSGFKGIEAESEDLYSRMAVYDRNHMHDIEWNRREKEIQEIDKKCTFTKCKTFYEKLFAPANALV